MKFRIVAIVRTWESPNKLAKVFIDHFGEMTDNAEESMEFSNFKEGLDHLASICEEIHKAVRLDNGILFSLTVEQVW